MEAVEIEESGPPKTYVFLYDADSHLDRAATVIRMEEWLRKKV